MDPAPPNPLPLGAYDLVAPLAKGAMGEVWRGRHRATDTPLAIKCLRAKQDDWAEAAFRNEVRASAGLDHPGIVAVYDEGAVPAATAEASEGRLVAGRPYLVMELVDGRPLQGKVGRLEWPLLRDVLLQLLDALAHSHARGVIHRDLKPGNVLLSKEDGRLRARLTDFGLAQALDASAGAERVVAGTPAYMAPEQLQGDWRDQGPWTDLYSLGCLAWALTTGLPPFGRKRPFAEFCQDHLHRPPPPLEPRVPVPVALESWMRRLLQKVPGERYTRAADAADALRALPVAEMMEASEWEDESDDVADLADGPVHFPAADPALDGDASTGAPAGQPLDFVPDVSTRKLAAALGAQPLPGDESLFPPPGRPPLGRTRATLPDTWRRPQSGRERELPGVGLGLYSLRTLPMVGRDLERDRLWAALRTVEETGRARCVVLRGPSGTGKSRLASWLCEHAEELGGVVPLSATHASGTGPGCGIGPMFGRYLRTAGLDRADLVARLVRHAARTGGFDPEEAPAVAELVAPATEADVQAGARVVRFRDPRERYVLVHRLLDRLDAGPGGVDGARTSVVWLDDVQWGSDALAFTTHLLDAQPGRPTPVLIVMTAQEAALMDKPAAAIALEDLAMRDDVDLIEIGPLPIDEHRRLVVDLLGGDGPLASEVATRTAGSPLFAVQLVGDWASRGLLEGGPAGVHLKPGAVPTLPDDLHAVWQSRIDRLLEPFGDEEAQALELAAVLGSRVDRDEWNAVCHRRQLRPSPRLVDRLIIQRLAIVEKDGASWSFAHPMLRESLARRAHDHGRLAEHRRACASMLELRHAGRPGVSERIAAHLLAAEDDRDALPYLLAAAEERGSRGEIREAERLLDARLEAMERVGLPASASGRAAGWPIRQRVLRLLGRVEEAAEHVAASRALAAEHGWSHALAQATADAAQLAHHAGRVGEASDLIEEALRLAADLADPALMAEVRTERARLRIERGRLEAAVDDLEQARRDAGAAGHELDEAQCWMLLGRVAKQQGDLDAAMARFSDALGVFERAGDRWGVASCTNELGEVARLQGDHDGAEVHYRDALHRMEELGVDNVNIVRVNLAMVLLLKGHGDGAEPLARRALAAFESTGQKAMIGIAHLVLMACAASANDWSGWDVHLAAGREAVRDTRFVEQDIALIAALAGDIARRGGWVDRARAAWRLAQEQWEALGRPLDVAAIKLRIAEG